MGAWACGGGDGSWNSSVAVLRCGGAANENWWWQGGAGGPKKFIGCKFLFMGRKQKSSNVRNKNGFADMIREMDEVSSMTDKADVVTSGKVAGSSFSLLEVSNISSMVDKSAENIQPLLSPSCSQTLGDCDME
ncbi:hypothetical protein Fot_03467 [Forsythia ovata]|uniref:Uncharacterized protein n=1 Tax=Forsythia ovata TaxID=205694 RepID=A0ABD1XCT8_9LAMI